METGHRPWPLPRGPWVMAQSWHDLLFAHWRVPAGELRPLLPPALEIETFGGSAWVGVIPFRMTGVRLRGTPALYGLSAFPELNVRTYVTDGHKPGVWFFSLDASNRVAVGAAQRWFHLPYFLARTRCGERGGWIEYGCERKARNSKIETRDATGKVNSDAAFHGRYRPTGEVFRAGRGTIEHFLTERYCLYALDGRSRLLRAEIHHVPWPLQTAEAEIRENTMAAASAIRLPPEQPLLQFSRRMDVRIWNIRRVNGDK